MNTWSLALRNLLRNRRRSLATILAMVVGLVAILLFGGYRSNIMYGMKTGFVQHSGHLQVQREGYFQDGGDNPSAYGISDYPKLIDAIRRDSVLAPMLAVVTPTLHLGGVAGNFSAGVSRSVIASGVDVEAHNRMRTWNEFGVVSYAQPLALQGSAPDAVVIGTGVARRLKLCEALQVADCTQTPTRARSEGAAAPADVLALSGLEQAQQAPMQRNRIEMLAATAGGAPNVASLSVVKANNMGVKALDDVYMAMHLSQAQKLIYGSSRPEVTAIVLQLQRTADLPKARARLETLLQQQFAAQGLAVLDYQTLNPMYVQTDQFMGSMFGFIALLIGVIVLFTIGNTMSTAVMERTVEIGTLRAMGLRRSGIRRLFMCEALLLGLIGSALGLLAALGMAYLINHSGWTWVPPGYSYAYLILVRVWQDVPLLVGSIVGMIGVTVLSAWWPARRAAGSIIVDALRHS